MSKTFAYILIIFLTLPFSAHAASAVIASKIIVYKNERRLELIGSENNVIHSYKIALGKHPEGHKTQEGDGKTPEGLYWITAHNSKSSYHRSLKISYPNATDREQASKRGISPGGDIMIHGLRNGLGFLGSLHRLLDWTQGCIALTNDEIEAIWKLVPDNTPVEIRP